MGFFAILMGSLLCSLPARQLSSVSQFAFEGRSITVVAIDPAHPQSDLALGEVELAQVLLDRAARWRLQHRQKFYLERLKREVPIQFLTDLETSKASRPLERSSLIFFLSDEPQDMVASIEYVWRSQRKDELPSERDFHFKFENDVLGELVSFEIEDHLSQKFLPVLLKIFHELGVARQKLKTAAGVWTYPRRFVMTTFSDFLPYYSRFSFNPSQEQPDSRKFPDIIAMEILREIFENHLVPSFRRRTLARNLKITEESSVDTDFRMLFDRWKLPSPAGECQAHLGIVSQILAKKFPRGSVQVRSLVRQVVSQP